MARNQESTTRYTAQRPDVFLFSHSRTASNLLSRLLSNQSGWTQSDYHFDELFSSAKKLLSKGPIADLSHDQIRKFEELIRDGYDNLRNAQESAKSQNQRLFVKNHTFHVWDPEALSRSLWEGAATTVLSNLPIDKTNSFVTTTKSNPTIFSDEFLTSWIPIFMIRHPALVFESWYRTETKVGPIDIFDKSGSFHTTFKYSRELYDWYITRSNDCVPTNAENHDQGIIGNPIVIDADDIVEQNLKIEKICMLCGMDPDQVLYQWETVTPENSTHSARHQSFMSGLWNSTSVDKSKSSRGLDMRSKANEWRSLYGDTTATELSRLVEDAMPDYLYLKSKKV